MTKRIVRPPFPHERLAEIVAAVARRRNTTVADIMSHSRFTEHVVARHIAIRAIKREFPELSNPKLGRFFNRDATTILYALGGLPNKRRRASPRAGGTEQGERAAV